MERIFIFFFSLPCWNSIQASELRELKKESDALKVLRGQLGQPNFGELVFKKVFGDDIIRLLDMKDMWKNRVPPQPLDYHKIQAEGHTVSDTNIVTGIETLENRKMIKAFLTK